MHKKPVGECLSAGCPHQYIYNVWILKGFLVRAQNRAWERGKKYLIQHLTIMIILLNNSPSIIILDLVLIKVHNESISHR